MKAIVDARKTWWLWRETQNRLIKWGHALLQGRTYSIKLSPEGQTFNDAQNQIIQVNPQVFSSLDVEKQFRLTQGLLAHEVGHALFSDAWPDQEDNLLCEMTNILEDGRIENALSVLYPGIQPVIEKLNERMLKNVTSSQCSSLPDELQAYSFCLIWRWACGQMEENKMLAKLHISPGAQSLWNQVKPLVEEAWKAKDTKRVIEIAQSILSILDIPRDQPPQRTSGVSSSIPRERKGKVNNFPSRPADFQPGAGLGSMSDMPVFDDRFSLPRPYIELENQAVPFARQLADSLKIPTPNTHDVPHEYAGRFNMRQDLRTPETPNLAKLGVEKAARSLSLYLLVDRSGSMCEVDGDVRLAMMIIYLAATSLEIPIGIAYFGSADHFDSPDRVFELTSISSRPSEEVKALIAGFEGVTGAEFLNWGLTLAEKNLMPRVERTKVLVVIHDGKPVYKGEDGIDWDLSCAHLKLLEKEQVTTFGVYLGTNTDDHAQLKILFPHLLISSGKNLPGKLGALLRGLAK